MSDFANAPDLGAVIAEAVADAAPDGDAAVSDSAVVDPAESNEPAAEPVADPQPAAGDPPPAPEPSADDEYDLDKIPTHQDLIDGRKRENKIPHSKVQRIVENARTKVQREWEAKVAEHTQKLTAYEREAQAMAQVEQMMQTNPEAFLQTLVRMNPAYSRFIGGGGGAAPAASHQQAPQAGMPQPDYDLGNGQKTYSMEGLQRLREWDRAQAVKEAEERMAQRFGPIEQQFKTEQFRQQAVTRVKALEAEARTWPMFNENETEILKELKADPNISLERAYQKVVLPKLAADQNAMRAKVLAEMKGRPTSTSAPVTGTPAPAAGPTDLNEVIRLAMKGK